MMKTIDYRKLMVKYLAYLGEEKGTDSVEDLVGDYFSVEEVEEIETMSKEAVTLVQEKLRESGKDPAWMYKPR